MDQGATWYGGRPRSSDVVLDEDPAPPAKRCTAPVFSPCLLWPNGWMDEDATWYGITPHPRPHCVRRGPSCPRERGTAATSFRPMSIMATIAHLSTAELLLNFLHKGLGLLGRVLSRIRNRYRRHLSRDSITTNAVGLYFNLAPSNKSSASAGVAVRKCSNSNTPSPGMSPFQRTNPNLRSNTK